MSKDVISYSLDDSIESEQEQTSDSVKNETEPKEKTEKTQALTQENHSQKEDSPSEEQVRANTRQAIPSVDGTTLSKRDERTQDYYNTLLREQQELIEQNNLLKSQLQSHEALVAQTKTTQLQQHKSNLSLKEEAVVRDLLEAKQKKDFQREIDLSKQLAEIKANQSMCDFYAHQAEKEQRDRQEDFSAKPQPPQKAYSSEDYAFLQRNPWANPDDPVNYSPELLQEALGIGKQLEKTLKLQGKGHLIGTKDYYAAIEASMGDFYRSGLEDDSQNTPNSAAIETLGQDTQAATVKKTPKTNKSISGESGFESHYIQDENSNKVILSPEERTIALQLNSSSGKSEEEALAAYAKYKKEFNEKFGKTQNLQNFSFTIQ